MFGNRNCGRLSIPKPGAPTLSSVATNGTGTLRVTWSAGTGTPTSYNLYWATSPGVTTASNKITGATSPYDHTGRTVGTTYYYKVAGVNAGGEGVLSSELSGASVTRIVAGGTGGELAYSDDNAVSWTKITSPTANKITDGIFANSLYVICTSAGEIFSSTDTVNWTSKFSDAGYSFQCLAYGGSGFVAYSKQDGSGGGNHFLVTSADGSSWAAGAAISSGMTGNTVNPGRIAFGAGEYVLACGGANLNHSANLTSWTNDGGWPEGGGHHNNDLIFANSLFVAVGNDTGVGLIYTSTTGLGGSWTSRTVPAGVTDIFDITYGNGQFVARCDSSGSPGVLISANGTTGWARTAVTPGSSVNFHHMIYINSKYVAADDAIRYSSNGTSWTNVASISGLSNNVMWGIFG